MRVKTNQSKEFMNCWTDSKILQWWC